MPNLKDNLKQWREAARIDWFSHFVKAWIPFNAWMTDTYGDLRDSELIDKVKGGGNVVYNRIVPILTRQKSAQDTKASWQDPSPEGEDFRLRIHELHRLLQSCVVDGRRGRVSFETVDIGYNTHADESVTKWRRTFRVRRGHPNAGEVSLEMSATKATPAFSLTLSHHDRRALEDEPLFRLLKVEQRALFLAMHASVAPRKVITVLAEHGSTDVLRLGDTDFIADPSKVFSALIDILYSLRNTLFHGSITPNEQHNEIYEPAYHVVMRLVRCTL